MIFPYRKKIKKIKYQIGNQVFKQKEKECEICYKKKTTLFQNCGKIGNSPGKYGYLPIKICKNCNLKFISPRPSNKYYKKFFNLDYGATYYGSKYKPNKNHVIFQKLRGKLIFDFFKKYLNKKDKILDHGCSTGLTMIPWRKAGFKINGIDPHRPSVNFGKEKYKLDIDFAFGEKLPYQSGTYNSVISLGSLEHCFDLNKCLSEIHRILISNGTLIIRWRSDKLIGSPLEYFGYNTLKFLNKNTWKYVLNRNNFKITKLIKKKVERYDSFEYIIAKKVKRIKKTRINKSFKSEIYKFKKHYNYYKRLSLEIEKNKNKNSMKFKKQFIKKNGIGLMNIGASKSINRFFNETKFFLTFIRNFKNI